MARLQQELLTLASDMRELERRGEERQREAGEQQRLMMEANRQLAEHEAKVEGLHAQLTEAQLQRKAAEKRFRDLEGELDGRRLLYEKTAQLCEDKRYRELIIELQREARNADARKDAAVSKMEAATMELERLKVALCKMLELNAWMRLCASAGAHACSSVFASCLRAFAV